MSDLNKSSCEACHADAPKLSESEINAYLKSDIPEWSLITVDDVNRFKRVYKFKNFTEALAFTVKVGILAEKEDHHPLIQTEWGKVSVQWWTHKIKGLHKNDAICASKTDKLFSA